MKSMKNTMKCLVAVFIMAMAFAVTGITAEAAVTNMKQIDDSSSSVEIQFVTVNNYDYYGVQVFTDATCTTLATSKSYVYTSGVAGSIETKSIYGLQPGRSYYVKVGYGTSSSACYNDMSAAMEVVTAPSGMTAKWVSSNDTQVAFQVYAAGANSYAFYSSQDVFLGAAAVQNVNAARTLVVNAYTPDGYYDIYPVRYNAAKSYAAMGSYAFIDASVLTTKIAKKNFGLSNVYSGLNEISVGAAYYGSGFQAEVTNAGSSKYKKTATGSSRADVPYKQNRYLKYRVRAYVDTDAGRVYGKWSDYRAFAEMNGKYTPKYKSVYLKWTKVKGSGKIKVQVSTKKDSKYKTFKTLKGSAKSVTVTKYGKKALGSRKNYYVKVTPMVKIGKKYVASDYYLRQSFRTR